MKKILVIIAAVLAGCSKPAHDTQFARVENGKFIVNGKPYYFAGVNFWYGAILGAPSVEGGRERLARELDFLKSIGADNLRILVGSDGKPGVVAKVEPTLQTEPGVYNDDILDGLDWLLAEMEKRGMLAVLYLNNSWEWSGGYSQYLEWAGHSKAPVPAVDGWPAYMEYVKQFIPSAEAKRLFANYVSDIVTRTNRYTGRRYTDDPTIFSWQIGNEPRAFSEENKEAFGEWIGETARMIRALDPNHMISTGSEGRHGCENDILLCEKIHAFPEISYVNIHIWPYNWGWIGRDTMFAEIGTAKENTKEYVEAHLEFASRLQKPVVLEEFGFPRDNLMFSPDSPTTLRDTYYKYVFDMIESSKRGGGLLAGCNIWGWGGFARPSAEHVFWQPGDDYTGDPAQEEQGLNSVFATDVQTVGLIRATNEKLK